MPTPPPLRSLLLLLLLLAVACGPVRRVSAPDDDDDDDSAADDDDATDDDDDATGDDDDASDDDDTTPLGPYEGEWTGSVSGQIRFDTVEYGCTGEAVVHIDALNVVNGSVDCPITDNPDQNCGFTLPKVGLVLDGPDAIHAVGCTGNDWPGRVEIVTDTFVQGTVEGTTFDEGLGLEVQVLFTYSVFR